MSSRPDILLTGASGAIGSAITRRLASAGFNLHLTSRAMDRIKPLAQEIASLGGKSYIDELNLQNIKQCHQVIQHFFERAENPFGLICNAGDLGILGSFLSLDFDEWAQSLQQNFVGHAAMIHSFGQGFEKSGRKGGSIVVLSGAGLGSAVNHPSLSSYGTAKAALTYLTEALSLELNDLEIRINAIAPGQVNSHITDQAIQAGIERVGAYAASAQKCKETGGVSPDLAAQLVEFLMSPSAQHITGRLLSARFDQQKLRAETASVADDPHMYRLRRIDHDLFSPRA